MLKVLSNNPSTIATADPLNTTGVPIARCKGFYAKALVTVNTPAAQSFTANDTTMIFTATAHGMLTGLAVQVSNSGGALPTGLSGSTTYYVINLTANTFQLATTLAHAIAGTNLSISSNGTGTQTVTPTAIATATVQLAGSDDGVTYIPISGSSNSITATANFAWNVVDPMYDYVQIQYSMASGQISSVQNIRVKGSPENG